MLQPEPFVAHESTLGPHGRVLVFSGGAALVPPTSLHLPAGFDAAFVVAADAGAAAALALGLAIDVLVGDLDSIDDTVLGALDTTTTVERHATDKDATDLDLALTAAIERGAREICVVDAAAGRLDHFLATLLLLASPRWHGVEMRAVVDGAHVVVVPPGGRRVVPAPIGRTVSLIAVDAATGVSTDGMQYALTEAALPVGVTLGVSNVVTAPGASVAVTTGTVLVVVPAEEAPS